jgi:hypothetical protein
MGRSPLRPPAKSLTASGFGLGAVFHGSNAAALEQNEIVTSRRGLRRRRFFVEHPSMTKKIDFTAADKEAAWAMYATRADLRLADIATHFGVSISTIRVRVREWQWPPRLLALAPSRREAARRIEGLEAGQPTLAPVSVLQIPARQEPLAPLDLDIVAQSLGRNALQQLESLEAAVARGKADPERAARTLASLSRTLAAARAMECKGGAPVDDDDDEPAGRSLEDIRQELARHLDRLVAEEELERSFGFDDPERLADTA